MSLGKFEPGAFNHLKNLKSHSSNNANHYEVKLPSFQALSNGFSDFDHNIQVSRHIYPLNGIKNEEEEKSDLQKYIHIEVHPNGGASVVHMYESEFAHLDSKTKEKLASMFFEEVFQEEPVSVAKHVIGIVHGAAAYMPEMVSHLATTKPNLDIKVRMDCEQKEFVNVSVY